MPTTTFKHKFWLKAVHYLLAPQLTLLLLKIETAVQYRMQPLIASRKNICCGALVWTVRQLRNELLLLLFPLIPGCLSVSLLLHRKHFSKVFFSLFSCDFDFLAEVSSHLHHPRIVMPTFWQCVDIFGVRTNAADWVVKLMTFKIILINIAEISTAISKVEPISGLYESS